MRVLFFVRHPGYIRNYESALRELGARGHTVHVAFDSMRASWQTVDPLEALLANTPGLTSGNSPRFAKRKIVLFDRVLRHALDYFRYFEREYAYAPMLRIRAGRRVPIVFQRFPGLRFRAVRRPLAGLLRLLLRVVPPIREVDEYISEQRPDVVLITPLVALGSPQMEYVRAARRLGIPSVHCVTSWDNLTNKGLLHELPDGVLVWNDAQQSEAIELHGVPSERIAVTGAQCYDHWFGRMPSTTREEFCANVGLDPSHPIVLYLCSSPFVAPREAPFFERWLEALRGSGSPLADAGVLVRPHPQNAQQWEDVEPGGQAVVWPRAGADPVYDEARSSYFDSMYHAGAIVGVNTSGMIESAIVGRPVHTVLDSEFRFTQTGTLHFAHIAGEGGMLHVAESMEEHLASLAESLNDAGGSDVRNRAFVERFIRPRGLDRPAAKEFTDAVERLAAREPAQGQTGERAPAKRRDRTTVHA